MLQRVGCTGRLISVPNVRVEMNAILSSLKLALYTAMLGQGSGLMNVMDSFALLFRLSPHCNLARRKTPTMTPTCSHTKKTWGLWRQS